MGMMGKISLALALSAIAMPASAEIDWKKVTDAFQNATIEHKQLAESEYLDCGAKWDAWDKAVAAHQVPATAEALLDERMRRPASEVISFDWWTILMDEDLTESDYEAAAAKSAAALKQILSASDETAMLRFARTLGYCDTGDFI